LPAVFVGAAFGLFSAAAKPLAILVVLIVIVIWVAIRLVRFALRHGSTLLSHLSAWLRTFPAAGSSRWGRFVLEHLDPSGADARGVIPNTPTDIAKLVRKLSKGGHRLEFCYEAGGCGYGIYRQLLDLGHGCMAVAPIVDLTIAIGLMNTFNRIAIGFRRLPQAALRNGRYPLRLPTISPEDGSLAVLRSVSVHDWLILTDERG